MILLSFTEVSLTGADYTNSPVGLVEMHFLHAISLLACYFTNSVALESIFLSSVCPLAQYLLAY